MSDHIVCMDHSIVWQTEPYMVWAHVRFFAGLCSRCGKAFMRQEPDMTDWTDNVTPNEQTNRDSHKEGLPHGPGSHS